MTEDLPEPWCRLLDDRQRLRLEEEIIREVSSGHPLAGLALRVIAKRDDGDDALLTLDESENGRVAEVHLTWSGKMEPDPRWPMTTIYESLGEWRSGRGDEMN
jgi:hypothetical protein